jgi:hypothetical protein
MPGIYYIQSSNGFGCSANCDMYMATGVPADATTGWTGNMLVYNTGPAATPTNTGQFSLTANGTINLVGSPSGSSYLGILFFQDRNSAANTGKNAHSLGGNGSLILKGTLYFTNTLATMKGDATHYQEVDLQGTPGNTTLIQGEVIVGALGMGGNGSITMNLNSDKTLDIAQVAMVN